jgi:uncharacterized protein (UPF0264 family)
LAELLVSVRSAQEARAAVAGGAAVIDVKEPARGPLGQADFPVWQAVRHAVPRHLPVSVALGELGAGTGPAPPNPRAWNGVAYRKLGFAGAGPAWKDRWAGLLQTWRAGPPWIAVAYADWTAAHAPPPDEVLDTALASGCAGVLVDTWTKGQPCPLDLSWTPWVQKARHGGLLVALAGGLDAQAIHRLAPLDPDLFAVRTAACAQNDRRGPIDPSRVARLARMMRRVHRGRRGEHKEKY